MFTTLKLFFTILLAAIFGAGPSTPVASTTGAPAGPAPAMPAFAAAPAAAQLHTVTHQTIARAPLAPEPLKLEASDLTTRVATRYKVCSHTTGSRLILVCPPPALLR